MISQSNKFIRVALQLNYLPSIIALVVLHLQPIHLDHLAHLAQKYRQSGLVFLQDSADQLDALLVPALQEIYVIIAFLYHLF